MPHQSIVFGIELTATHIYMGLVSEDGSILNQSVTKKITAPADLPKVLLEHLEQLLSKSKLLSSQLTEVGISVSNPSDYTFLDHALSTSLNVPVIIRHIGCATAIAEKKYGMAGHWQNYIAVSINDSSLQCGLVLSGELATGEHQIAGNIGHMLVHIGENEHHRLHEYISEEGIKKIAWKLIADMPQDSNLKNYNYREMQANHIIQSALSKDPISLAVFAHLGTVLGQKLSEIIHHVSPEYIILSSHLSELPGLLLEATKESMEKNTLAVFRGKAQLLVSSLPSNEAPILRGAALA